MAKEYIIGNVMGPKGEEGPQGVSVTNVEINEDGHLIVTLSNGNIIDAGEVAGPVGKSAYESALEGGYTGTEEEFNEFLSSGQKLPENILYGEISSDPPQPSVPRDADLLAGYPAIHYVAKNELLELVREMIPANAGAHNAIYRGKALGDAVTSAQYEEIAAGTFRDLYIGDYWTIGGVNWRIASFDYYYNTGDTACTTHHAVMMPDTALYNSQMNETNTTDGGYVGSLMYREGLEQAKATINASFPGHVLNHREYLIRAVTNGCPSEGTWYDSTVELPNEIMMYGSLVFAPEGDGSFVPNCYTIDKMQLALMKLHPRFINPQRQSQWLRDVISSALFAYVDNYGGTNCLNASNSRGVRPVFGLVG